MEKGNLENAISIFPSPELADYIINTLDGNNKEIPLYGQEKKVLIGLLPKDKSGDELVELRIPFGQSRRIEKIYQVRRTVGGEINIIDVGFYTHGKNR